MYMTRVRIPEWRPDQMFSAAEPYQLRIYVHDQIPP